MRRLPLCFFLIAFTAPFAFADGSSISRAIPSSTSTDATVSNTTSRGASTTRPNASRTTTTQSVQKTVQSATTNNNTSDSTTTRSATDSRNVVSRTATTTNASASDSDVVRVGSRVLNLGDDSATSRGTSTTRSGGSVSRAAGATHTNTARDNLNATVNTVGRNARVESASINNNPTVRRAGLTLRPSTAEVGGRATIAGTDIQTGSNISSEARSVAARATTSGDTTITTESIAAAKERMDLVSNLNSSCQQQYNDCMDQFCSVIDSNQKRCSCSANLNDYTDVEEAVTDANNQLNEVAQRIRYVGLTEEEIDAIMSATEAEEALSGAKDTTETRNMLEEIEELIRDPVSTSSSYSSNSGLFGLDMDLDFSSNTADLFSLDFLNTGSTSNLSNMRGTQLYNAAKNRCKTILDQCEEAGANIDQITANYDLAIDRDCIAYEQGLQKMNETLVSNVRSANLMLQKARLAVLENQNQYDAKACIAALDECMRDDMVCGEDYTKCLDPTKTYIDENGSVVLGQDITKIIDFMARYNNSAIDKGFLQNSYSMAINDNTCSVDIEDPESDEPGNNGACIASFLLKKIGTKQEVQDEGLCRAVLDKCRAYTYDDRGNYLPYNDVVVNYIQRAMVNIQAAQRQIISDYASNCVLDIANCYNQQVTQVNTWSSSASVSSVYNVMRGACRNVALTCAYAVFKDDTTSCPVTNDEHDDTKCLESISEMFYQSLLCPDNSMYITEAMKADTNTNTIIDEIKNGCESGSALLNSAGEIIAFYPLSRLELRANSAIIDRFEQIQNSKLKTQLCKVNNMCVCNYGYEVWNGQCLAACGKNASRNDYGTCVCDSGYVLQNGTCVKQSTTDTTE